MLEIYANGKRLHLPDDIEIDMTFENPFFTQGSVPATHSMTFTLPPTKENLQVIGNANRIAAAGVWSDLESRVLFNSSTISVGRLKLQETEKLLKFYFVGSLVPDLVRKRMNLLNVDLYEFGEGLNTPDDFDSGWPLVYKNTIETNAKSIGDKFAVCPVRVTGADWKRDEVLWGFLNAHRLYLNPWNVNNGSYLFTQSGDPTVHSTVFPQPYIHYLIDLVFGASLNSNFIKDDAELKKLAMITSFHKSFSEADVFTYSRKGVIIDSYELWEQRYFYLSSYFNKYAFNDFLKNILKVFCGSLMPRPDGKWDILLNKDIMQNTDIVDWTNKLVGTPLTTNQKAQRYIYGYSSEALDLDNGGYATVASIEAMMASSTETTYKIASTGEIYEKRLKDPEVPGEYEYERLKTGLGGFDNSEIDDDETYSMQSDVQACKMRPDVYWHENSGVTRNPWYVPEFSGNRFALDFAPEIGFMRGFYNLSTKQIVSEPEAYSGHYPLLTPYNYDPNGNKVGDYSLAWEGADGLFSKFHQEFKEYIESDHLVLKGNFHLTHLDLKNLDFKKKSYIRGKLFYLKKIETKFRKRSISLSKCELMEA